MNNFYVYIHRKKSNNEIFYVGKGKDRRAYWKSRRNQYWQNIVNKYGYIVEILKDNLTENEAFNLEMETIKEYKKQNINLCNMTNGGEGMTGFKHSEETKRLYSKNRTAKLNVNYDNTKRNFIHEDNTIECCTQYELSMKYNLNRSGITMLCKNRITTFKGWRLLETTKYGRNNGKDNYNYNHTIYTFYNKKENKTVSMTQQEFSKQYSLNHSCTSAICRDVRKETHGWICKNPIKKNIISDEIKNKISNSLSGRKNHNYDATIRKFKHKDGTIEICTMNELKVKYSLGCHISSVVHGKFTHHRGWSYLGVVETTPKA